MVLTSAPMEPAAVRSACVTPATSGGCVPPDVFRLAVEARTGHRLRDFRVEVSQGVGVVLYGWSDCYYVKQLAQHVVGRVSGLPILANWIAVVTPCHGRA